MTMNPTKKEIKKTRATPRRRPCESRQICRTHPLPEHFLLLQIHYKKKFGLANEKPNILIQVDICHEMDSRRMLYSVTLT